MRKIATAILLLLCSAAAFAQYVAITGTNVSYANGTATATFVSLGGHSPQVKVNTVPINGSGYFSLTAWNNNYFEFSPSQTTFRICSSANPATCYTTIPATITAAQDISAALAAAPMPSSGSAVSPAQQLPNWRLALAKARTGGGDAKVLFVGDSTTAGYSTTGTPTFSLTYPSQLMKMFVAGEVPVAATSGFTSPIQLYMPATFPATTGWTLSAFNGYQGAVGCSNLVWTSTDGNSYDTYDIYYLGSSGLGAVNVQATGGTLGLIQGNQTISNTYKQTITAGTASPSNTVTFSNCSNANVYITAIEPSLSTTSKVRFANFGIGGSTTANWVLNSPAFYQLSVIPVYAPNLTVIMLGINDAVASTACSTTIANLQIIITAAQLSGDVILATVFPSTASGTLANEQSCYPSYLALAKTDNLPMVDIFGRFGAVAPAAAFTSDGVHPTAAGYLDMAGAVWKTLQSVQ